MRRISEARPMTKHILVVDDQLPIFRREWGIGQHGVASIPSKQFYRPQEAGLVRSCAAAWSDASVLHRFVGRQVHWLSLVHAVGNVLGLALTEVIDHRVAHIAQELWPMVLGMRFRP